MIWKLQENRKIVLSHQIAENWSKNKCCLCNILAQILQYIAIPKFKTMYISKFTYKMLNRTGVNPKKNNYTLSDPHFLEVL